MDDQFKHYPLPPEGVELMREYNALQEQLIMDVERLQKEYMDKAQSLKAATREKMQTIWVQMAAMAGVDASASWDNQNWHIEGRYTESGFAALTFYQPPANPIVALLGQQPTDDTEDTLEKAPKGVTLN